MIYDVEKAKIVIEWTDKKGKKHKMEFNELNFGWFDEAETIIGLMTGNICLADLEP